MARNNKEDAPIDLYSNRRWLHTISTFGDSKSPLYIAYMVLFMAILFYILVMAAIACYLVSPDKILVVTAAHVVMIDSYVIIVVTNKILSFRSMNDTNQMMISGIYTYSDEMNEEQLQMRAQSENEYKRLTKIFISLFITGGIGNLTTFPLTQFLVQSDSGTGVFNPYLPNYLLYMPFDTRTPSGYCLAYAINVVLVIVLYSVACSSLEMYIHCTVTLKYHLKMLNSSLRDIHRRAYLKFVKSTGSVYPAEELYEHKHFHACLYSCLRSNIQHHQALLKYRRALQPLHGGGMLIMYVMAAVIYAAVLYLILQKLPINYLVNLSVMLIGEQSNLLIMCLLGEAVREESIKLTESLYHIPWPRCNKSFNAAAIIMMCKTLEPIQINALLIGKAADVNAYGELMSAMYKIMNLWRQSDTTS